MTQKDTFVCVAPVGDQCGEAATWVPEERALYWTDVNRFLVHRFATSTGAVTTWSFSEPCVALFLTDVPGTLLLALGSRIIRWQPRNDRRQDTPFELKGWPSVRLNDGRPGPNGEIWIGSMANNVGDDGAPGNVVGEHGMLFRVTPKRFQPQLVKSGIGISNTVCFSPDRRTFYFGDTPRNIIWRYDYDPETGLISNEQPFFSGFERGLPDGSTVDAEGHLWNCRFGGGCIVRVAPDGSIDRVVDAPVTNLTTCEFGGTELDQLYVTTAAMMTDRFERLAGSLFVLNVGVAGLESPRVTLRPPDRSPDRCRD